MNRHRLVCRWPLAAVLLATFPALGWEPETHLALLHAAMGISAGAEARVPLEFRDAVYREVREPDFNDKECRFHCSTSGPNDPAMQAEQLLQTLTNPKVVLRPYQRAQMVGRYLHYVGDVVRPAALTASPSPKLPNFFANQDFIFWRERRPLATPLAAALRARTREAEWANTGSETSNPAIFRAAVNALDDALMLLPPRADAAGAADAGPVHFLVNRIDSGTAGKATAAGWEKTGHSYDTSYAGSHWVDSSGGYDVWTWNAGSKGGGQSFKKADLMERQGVQLAEVLVRQEADRVVLRVLFFNNSALCARDVMLKAGDWTWKMPAGMPPHAVASAEVTGPVDLLKRRFGHAARADNCEGTPLLASAVRADRRRVYGNGGSTPTFDQAIPEIDITRGTGGGPGPR